MAFRLPSLDATIYIKGAGMNLRLIKALKDAQVADDAFSAELQRVYGNRAGDMRYRYQHTDPRLSAALEAKLAADRVVEEIWGRS